MLVKTWVTQLDFGLNDLRPIGLLENSIFAFLATFLGLLKSEFYFEKPWVGHTVQWTLHTVQQQLKDQHQLRSWWGVRLIEHRKHAIYFAMQKEKFIQDWGNIVIGE